MTSLMNAVEPALVPAADHLAFNLPPIYAFSYAPALFIFCLLLQPSIPARISTWGRRALILPTLLFVAVAPFRWRISPVEFAVAFNFRLSIFGPDLILKALEWGLMDEKDRATKLSWVGFDEDNKLKELQEHDEVRADKVKEVTVEGATTAVSADKLKTRLRKLSVNPELNSSSAASSATNSPPSLANLVAGQLPTPRTSPPSTPLEPVVAAVPPRLHDTSATVLSKIEVRSAAAKEIAEVQRRHPMRVLIDACHFLSAMRGMGYAWGPAPPRHRSHHRVRHQPRLPAGVFLRAQARDFVRSQVISTACMIYQVLHRDGRVVPFLVERVPGLSTSHAALAATGHLANTVAYVTVGVSLYAQMLVGFSGAAIGIVLTSLACNALLDRFAPKIEWRWSFDSREYAPLFDEPFGRMGEGGVSSFWGFRWHALFKSPFTSLGFVPVMRFSRRLGIPKTLARFLAVYTVFILSAWMHVQAFASARWAAEPTAAGRAYAASLGVNLSSLSPAPWAELSFRERHGTWIFFLSQPVAIALETLYLSGNKKQIGGLSGRIWTTMWVAGIGAWAVGRSWLALGIAHGVPPVELWGWQRFVVPTAHLAPVPLFMRV
ncbi:wax synthase family protein [Sporobolomyces koalae]|uniref:wax synthase family protein n=1 Tax=Sporobolomyces koalae TaxID=500713 RepID=UPI0031793C5C